MCACKSLVYMLTCTGCSNMWIYTLFRLQASPYISKEKWRGSSSRAPFVSDYTCDNTCGHDMGYKATYCEVWRHFFAELCEIWCSQPKFSWNLKFVVKAHFTKFEFDSQGFNQEYCQIFLPVKIIVYVYYTSDITDCPIIVRIIHAGISLPLQSFTSSWYSSSISIQEPPPPPSSTYTGKWSLTRL